MDAQKKISFQISSPTISPDYDAGLLPGSEEVSGGPLFTFHHFFEERLNEFDNEFDTKQKRPLANILLCKLCLCLFLYFLFELVSRLFSARYLQSPY